MTSTATSALTPFVRGIGRAAARSALAIAAIAATVVAGVALLDAGILGPALLALTLLTVPAVIALGGLFLLGSGFVAIAEAAHDATVRDPS